MSPGPRYCDSVTQDLLALGCKITAPPAPDLTSEAEKYRAETGAAGAEGAMGWALRTKLATVVVKTVLGSPENGVGEFTTPF